MGKLTFITGGARSGKSSFALGQASKTIGPKAYIATAEALDEEMRLRIERHREERGPDWVTFEEPLEIAGCIRDLDQGYGAAVVDCLTLWLNNLMLAGRDVEQATRELLGSLEKAVPDIFVVSNEVGMGIVPADPLARRFRDAAGTLNRRVAEMAVEVYLAVSGIPVKIK